MAHTHSVVDNDTRFKVEAVSREIRADTDKVKSLQQYDHNSEVLTFEAPRYIEGHDLMSCNVVQIHYANIYSDLATRTEEVNKGVYTVKDLAVDTENEDLVVFSWKVEADSTQLMGALNFVISFVCVDENGDVTYRWNTALCKLLSVDESLNNSEEVAEKHPDVIADLEARIKVLEQGGVDVDLSKYATTEYVDKAISNVDLTGYAKESYVDEKIGNIETALDGIIAQQNELIGGEPV
jgi:hypothetical protein